VIVVKSDLHAWTAGAMLAAQPARTTRVSENAMTGAFSAMLSIRGNPSGAVTRNRWTADLASATPRIPPNTSTGAASAIACATNRLREAPSASRIANSPLRELARAENSVDRFTQAMSRRNETAPSRRIKVDRTSRTASASIESTVMPALPP
jgi:hypothetical protein